ncbi:alcohol dehydrogenase [Penicillium cataractarum]|uniref:Alcohol dehydrogenase n=1 Tax=Penicillium cataractarum TaxID=2100454 RepID=A0A9W9VVW0_9EURO|nr:alcohol dehydrogenase [Penicillium cataractarum]KAJ5390160.1 alcohol dehydrogenase [Penicillium cataractarum]
MTSNKAAWIKGPGSLVEVETVEKWVPGGGELLVQVEAVNFNPIDAKLQRSNIFQPQFPIIVGFTFAGTVTSTGPDVISVKPGDRVVVARWGQTGSDNKFGALQKYALALEENTLKLEPEISFEDASGVIANLATVVSALNIYMGLSLPPITGKALPNGKRVLVYGGSSAVGGLAVKYASDAGYEVVTTSSTANKKLVEERNAAHIIDHCQPKEDLLRELRGHGPYEGIFEAIGSQTTTQLVVELLRETGGQFFSTSPSPGDGQIPNNVQKKWAGYSETLASQEANRELRAWYLERYLPEALKNRSVWPNPALWLKGGLNSTQEALDLLYDGKVSGKKIFLNPQD